MIVGVTGSLGTGKTTVAKMFAAKGAKVVDADKLSHMGLKKHSYIYKKIISRFGRSILNKNRTINKRKLAEIVFGDDAGKLRKLTRIIHPFVIKKIKHFVSQLDAGDVAVIDAPLLIEAGLASIIDKLVVVRTDRVTQLSRCAKRGNKALKRDEWVARIKNQMPLDEKVRMADYVVDNNGTLKKTKKQVGEIWQKLRK